MKFLKCNYVNMCFYVILCLFPCQQSDFSTDYCTKRKKEEYFFYGFEVFVDKFECSYAYQFCLNITLLLI